MNMTIARSSKVLFALLLVMALITLASGAAQQATADEISITLDGVRDNGYVFIEADPFGDLASSGPAGWIGTQWADLTNLYVAADSSTLYVYADLPGYFSTLPGGGDDSTGQIGLALDTDGQPNSGGSSDAWGNAISFVYNNVDGFDNNKIFLPDYLIRGNVSNDDGWTELRTWNGSSWDGGGTNWGGIDGGHVGSHIAYAQEAGVEFAIPLADIGNVAPGAVHLQIFTTQGGNLKGAYDTIAIDDQSEGWDDPTTQKNLVTVPLAVDPAGDLASPGPADSNGVTWTDQTRIHVWADDANLFIFLPSKAYDTAVSEGQIAMAIDTKAGGGTSDPWGNAIIYDYQNTQQNLGQTPVAQATPPDYMIRGNIFGPNDNGWTELRSWNGSDWNSGGGTDWGGIGNSGAGSQPNSKVAWTSGDGLRLRIPFADIGVVATDTISLQFLGTQGGGGKGAYDTVPSDDQSDGWDDATTQQFLATYVIPDIDSGAIEIPPKIAALVTAPARDPIQDEVFYFVMPDRFDDGNEGNNTGGIPGDRLDHGFDKVDKGFFHGGDLQGLIDQLDYLDAMGTTAIWMTPVFKNNPVQGSGTDVSAGYHGYWYVDMTQFDPHFGTNAELESLITEAHNRGMKVFFDIITNHTADIIDYQEGTYGYRNKEDYPYKDASGAEFDDRDFLGTGTFPELDPAISFPYTPLTDTLSTSEKVPAWLNDLTYYHNRGNSSFSGENSLYGDFFGLDDMFTEHPDVVDGMIDIYKSWITDYDIDGYRIDTVKHVNLEFWQEFTPAILAHAESVRPEKDFFVFGEVFSGNPVLLSHYTNRADFPAVLDFQFQEKVRLYVSGDENNPDVGPGPSNIMRDLFASDDYYIDSDSNAYALPTFLGNHDRGRFGWFLDVDNGGPLPDADKKARSQLATAMMFFSRGVPVIYYGDEQGFVGDGGDKDARQDMMPSQVPSYNDDDLIGTDATTADANFDPEHPLYMSYSDYAAILESHPALGTGAQLHRYSQDTAGIYAFSRIDRDEQVEYIVAFNNANSPQTAVFGTDSPDTNFGAIYPDSAAPIRSNASGEVTVAVPATGFVIYQAGNTLLASESAPGVAFNTLVNNQEIELQTPELDGNDVQERIEVGVALTDDKFAEVTFAVRKSGEADYTQNPFGVIGVDDNAPYRVFFSLEDVPGGFDEGDMLDFVAVVTDNNGNLSYAEVTGIKPIEVAPPEPPQPGEAGAYAIIHYFRDDGDYGDHTLEPFNFENYWGLHLWGDIDETIVWDAPKPFLGEDEYGRFAWVKLAENPGEVGFIVHRGNVKDGTESDRSFNPGITPEIWLRQDDANIYTSQAAAQGFVTIRYHRPDGIHDGWGLHLWGDAIDPSEATEWPSPKPPTGFDDFGAYWNVLVQDVTKPVNYIIHNDDDKDPGPDQSFIPEKMATVWIMSGDETIYPQQGAAQNFATIHYHRDDGDYGDSTSSDFNDFWGLHVWDGAQNPNPSWQEPLRWSELDVFGPVFNVNLVDQAPQLAHILHRGDLKDPGPDQFLVLDKWGYEVWQLEGEGPNFPDDPHYVLPILGEPDANPGNINVQGAYWVDEKTILWEVADNNNLTYTLHYAPDGGLEATEDGIIGGESILLGPGTISDEAAAKFPHLAGLPALWIADGDLPLVPDILKGQIAVSAVDADGKSVDATGLQIPGVLDDLYTYEGELGISWNGDVPTIRLWAPTAKSVTFNLFPDSDPATASTTPSMTLDPASGVWSISGDASWKGQYYLFDVEVYVHSTGQVEHNLVTDPYSLSLAMNSTRSQIVDLNDVALKPAGWDELSKPELVAPEDISIYEIHMRDFSVNDPSVPEEQKGTYKAFTLDGSNGVNHLKALQEAGLSHLHLLPVFDIATINENKAEWQEADWGELATYDPDGEEQQALITQYEDLDGFNWGYDPFHYTTPEGSYSTNPDGTTRIVEFREMVQAVNEDIDLRVVMDVVYNHTNSAGQGEKSVLDRIVPGYYHRLDAKGIVETSTCCQNTATEHNMMEKLMIDSLVVWARDYGVDAFRFDLMGHHSLANMLKVQAALAEIDPDIYIYGEGWNFGEVADNARFTQATQLNLGGTGIGSFSDRLRDAVRGGSPFNGGADLVCLQGFANGLFYDPNLGNEGFTCDRSSDLDTLLLLTDQIRVGMAGNLAEYMFEDRNGNLVTGSEVDYNGQPAGYTQDPQEDITYISKHDNQTLYDNNTYKNPLETSMVDRVRVQNVGLSTVLLGQGVPFMHAGSDLLRSKSFDRDSFNSGDWFNKLDFSYQENNYGVGLPVAGKNEDNWPIMQPLLANPALKPGATDIMTSAALFQELLAMRKSSPLFRLQTEEDVQQRVTFHNTGPDQLPGLIVMSIDDGELAEDLDGHYEGLYVFVNANDAPVSFTIPQTAGLDVSLHAVQKDSADAIVQTSSFEPTTGNFFVPGRTTAVFVSYEDPGDMIGDLIDWIDDLVDQGKIDKGQGTALTATLKTALKQLEDGKPVQAIQQMNVFINKVNTFVNSGKLSPETGAELIAEAEAIIFVIEAQAGG
jgi:pullulanase-type alpha-1,6-glucosidase